MPSAWIVLLHAALLCCLGAAAGQPGLAGLTTYQYNRDDFVIVINTDTRRQFLALASRPLRFGIRTLIAIDNETLVAQRNAGRNDYNETWVYFPNRKVQGPLRKKPGDTRWQAAPFLAHQHFGDTYKWMLLSDDDTLWFMAGVQRLLQHFDWQVPYAISDHFGDHNQDGYFVPSPYAGVCLPCHWSAVLPQLNISSSRVFNLTEQSRQDGNESDAGAAAVAVAPAAGGAAAGLLLDGASGISNSSSSVIISSSSNGTSNNSPGGTSLNNTVTSSNTTAVGGRRRGLLGKALEMLWQAFGGGGSSSSSAAATPVSTLMNLPSSSPQPAGPAAAATAATATATAVQPDSTAPANASAARTAAARHAAAHRGAAAKAPLQGGTYAEMLQQLLLPRHEALGGAASDHDSVSMLLEHGHAHHQDGLPPVVPQVGCPCTRELGCQHRRIVCRRRHCAGPPIFRGNGSWCRHTWAHGGAGVVLSHALLQRTVGTQVEHCAKTLEVHSCDMNLAKCLQHGGYMFTTPGYALLHNASWNDPRFIVFDNLVHPRVVRDPLGLIQGTVECKDDVVGIGRPPAGGICRWLVEHAVSVHIHARSYQTHSVAAAAMRAISKQHKDAEHLIAGHRR